eukprot:TRINITY_DN3659_c0_g1_i1.p1 TRINITY_DN3659_c0_g1~~TRINITY_DN3659_c0_g1_i1.p1  ORF type:complete len:208 (+),score=49.35 TRINITY_DN3659_c0_g1_i1:98-721(+)
MSSGDRIINLNIGGMLYTTTLSTLQKDTKSMLYAMFGGDYNLSHPPLPPGKTDNTGATFIDRDGKHFSYILNFLRDEEVDLPDKLHILKQILREARFFQIEGLVALVSEKIEHIQSPKGHGKSDYAVVYLGGYGNQAVVYSSKTDGGFSSSCAALNKLAEKGYRVEGVASGPNGNYYAILRGDRGFVIDRDFSQSGLAMRDNGQNDD